MKLNEWLRSDMNQRSQERFDISHRDLTALILIVDVLNQRGEEYLISDLIDIAIAKLVDEITENGIKKLF